MHIAEKIVEWYNINKRDLPWRETKDPYKIWVSEIILQQTRVEQGLNYYYQFIKNFPDVKSLAAATEESVLKCWQGLGYYSRARNMHFSAKYIVSELAGQFPNSFNELKKLKGVGDYTAAAIASFAFNQKIPLVDGNVFRFLSRLYAEATPIDTGRGKKLFLLLAEQLIQNQPPVIFNQAIMEFGALQCKPANPECFNCVMQANCIAFKTNKVSNFPVKSKKTATRDRYFNYFLVRNNGHAYLNKRVKNDIWKGLFELPVIETKSRVSIKTLTRSKDWENLFNGQKIIIKKEPITIQHQLSHQRLYIKFYEITFKEESSIFNQNNQFIEVPFEAINNYPVPKVVENYLSRFF